MQCKFRTQKKVSLSSDQLCSTYPAFLVENWEMEPQQEFEWNEAQKIETSVNLVAAAKQQLQFLAAVDKNRHLYDGPALENAIYRYNACWLPLLAKHSESACFDGPLVVPLDCEWVWHCHRLTPARYKSDCEELFGRILDNSGVVSTVQGICTRQTEELWNKMYPNEPYNADLPNASSENISERIAKLEKYTKYDLVSAANRQSPFFYQVSRPHMNKVLFIEEAAARYKGFLHLIKRDKRRSCVPTYDIDLIWHSHQLHPVSYCKDMNELLGKVLEHDDTVSNGTKGQKVDDGVSNGTKGQKVDDGFSVTTKQWEETFGTRYWRAGVLYRGNSPSPVTTKPYTPNMACNKVVSSNEGPTEIELQERKVVEVLMEFVAVKNLPEGQKENLFVQFSKSHADALYSAKRRLSISSETGEKQVASFQCEPVGELHFELMTYTSSNLGIRKSSEMLGSASLSLKDYLDPVSKLSEEKWLELVPSSGTTASSKPIMLRVAISFTVPTPAPYMLEMIQSPQISQNSCFMMAQHAMAWTHVIDESGAKIISLQMRDLKTEQEPFIHGKEVIGLMRSGETCVLAMFVDNEWPLIDNLWSFHLPNECGDDELLFELKGTRTVKVFPGRKLDYEPRYHLKHVNEKDYLTAVEFSMENPYGKAVALLDLRSGFVKAKEEWIVLPATILAIIASDILKKEGYESFIAKSKEFNMNSATKGFNCNVTNGECGGRCKSIVECGDFGARCKNKEETAAFGENGSSYGGRCKSIVECGAKCRNIGETGSFDDNGSSYGGRCKNTAECGDFGAKCRNIGETGSFGDNGSSYGGRCKSTAECGDFGAKCRNIGDFGAKCRNIGETGSFGDNGSSYGGRCKSTAECGDFGAKCRNIGDFGAKCRNIGETGSFGDNGNSYGGRCKSIAECDDSGAKCRNIGDSGAKCKNIGDTDAFGDDFGSKCRNIGDLGAKCRNMGETGSFGDDFGAKCRNIGDFGAKCRNIGETDSLGDNGNSYGGRCKSMAECDDFGAKCKNIGETDAFGDNCGAKCRNIGDFGAKCRNIGETGSFADNGSSYGGRCKSIAEDFGAKCRNIGETGSFGDSGSNYGGRCKSIAECGDFGAKCRNIEEIVAFGDKDSSYGGRCKSTINCDNFDSYAGGDYSGAYGDGVMNSANEVVDCKCCLRQEMNENPSYVNKMVAA